MSDAAVLFSGGSDSTLAAYLTSLEFDRVHLLTYKQFGQIDIENSKLSFKILDTKFPDKFVHVLTDVGYLFEKIYKRNYWRNLLRYGLLQHAFVCHACQAAFHIKSIVYCVKHSIGHMRDGANTEYKDASPMQVPIVKEQIKRFYAEYGITHESPVYDQFETNRSDFQLHRLGLREESNVKDDINAYKKYQGYCRFMFGGVFLIEYAKRCPDFPQKIQNQLLEHWLEDVPFFKELINKELSMD